MRRFAVCLLALALTVPFVASDRPASKTHEVSLNGHVFTLPTCFTIEVAARAPLVDRPIAADLDDEGRLFVADSSGSNEKVDVQLKKKPHRVVRLTDGDGDGVYDKSTVFADKMMFPEGMMCRDGHVYVAAPPSIWKLTDADDDGVAEKRSEWFEGKTLTGCANDLHGPYNGLDGWIYWCKGAFAEQRHKLEGRKELVTKAAHVFRARPDGSGIEPVMTGGMDNPVDVVFTASGERIFTTTFFQHPGNGLRDGLIHAIYGGVYGKEHAVLDNHPRTGPDLMPVLSHFGAAAPAGLHRYESDNFGSEYKDNLFAAQFNMAKVSRTVLTPHGATYKSREEDFVVSSNRDFHPTDVIEDADGSLLIIDTGGWYKLCCPTSQLVKPDVLGAIYRVRHKDAPKIDDPRGKKINWAKLGGDELTRLLGDARPVVRRRAIETLAKGNRLPVNPVTVEARRNAVWAATRVDLRAARSEVRSALDDEDETVRQAALHSVALWRDRAAVPKLLKLLESKSAHNQRGAAEALGRIGDAKAVPALLDAIDRPCDRVLEHSLIYAMMEINNPEAVKKGLDSKSARVRRAALLALDGMDAGKLDAAPVLKELDSSDAATKEAAWWIARRHPAWGDDLAGHFTARLAAADKLPEKEKADLAAQLSRFAASPEISALVASRLEKGSVSERRLLLAAMAGVRLKELPPKWTAALLTALEGELTADAVRAARQLPVSDAKTPKVTARLRAVAADDKVPAATRVAALAAIPGTGARLDAGAFSLLCKSVEKDQPGEQRGPAADVLSRAALSGEQLLMLAALMKSVGPMEVEPLLEPFAKGKDEKVGLQLMESLLASAARSAVRIDRLRARMESYPASVKKQVEALAAELDADQEKRKHQIDELLPLVKKADVRRGQKVFNNQKVACASCHAIGYLGGKLGPDLTRIGKVRDERDLLESILFPSASFVRSYEPVEVVTAKGRVHNGLVKRDSPEEVVLALNATEEVRIARADVDQVRPGKVSIMPAGLEKQLTAQELADLVAFLKACQ